MIDSVNVSNLANTQIFAKNSSDNKKIDIKNAQKVENSKVNEITKQIQNGTYKVDLNKISSAIADSLL